MSETVSTSHPDRPVRHSYPLANRDTGFTAALTLLTRTMPYALVRFGILFGVSVATIIWGVATFGGAALLGSRVHPFVGYGWMFAGLGAYGYVWRFILRYALYLIKCGHIAVLTELVTSNQISNGSQGMFAYGKEVVKHRFGQVNTLFALDLLIAGVVKAFNRTLDSIAGLIPIPGLDSIVGILKVIVRSATSYIDETIFSYNLARGDENPWRSSQDGLLYYSQNAQEILKTAVMVVILDKVLTVVAWIACLLPALLVATVIPQLGVGVVFVAALFAWNIRAALLEPLFLIMVMIKFHACVENQEINLEWDARLSSVSSKFAKIKEGIASWKPASGAAAPHPAAIAGPSEHGPLSPADSE